MNEIARDLQSAVTEVRAPAEHRLLVPDRTAPWAFEDVTRLHNQLRESGAVPPDNVRRTAAADSVNGVWPATWKWRLVFAGLGLALIGAGGFGWYLQNQVQVTAERAHEAELKVQQAARDAAQQAAAAREEAARQIASAREIADRAERIGNVLAAPDSGPIQLVRRRRRACSGGPGTLEPNSRSRVHWHTHSPASPRWRAPGMAVDPISAREGLLLSAKARWDGDSRR